MNRWLSTTLGRLRPPAETARLRLPVDTGRLRLPNERGLPSLL